MKFDNIMVVGGGSAGWMTAATLIHQYPNKKITLIESPDYPTVGVGESTIGGINEWLSYLKIEDTDFMPYCDASYKLSIRFENFYKKNDGGFHYPFGAPYIKNNEFDSNDWYYKKACLPELPITDYADCYYPQMALVNQNKIYKNKENLLPNFNFNRNTAVHFDATKFGLWLKEKYCLPRGVEYISEHIESVETDKNGIVSLNKKHKADLFIDCTGFKSLLLDKHLHEPFESYSDILPNNSAWATRLQYTDKEKELVSYTNCTALNNGWVWNIPLWSRIGTGYVYSDKYVSDEEALVEFKKHLGRDDLDFKNIKMRVGIHNRIFVKNVCAIGLSAGFIEPLESNGLFSVHDFLMKLIKVLDRDGKNISQFDKDTFNMACKARFRTFAEFVALHYALSHRDDTEYWRDVRQRTYGSPNIDYNRFITGFTHVKTDKMIQKKYNLFEGISCVATGMNYFPIVWSDIISVNCEPKYDEEKTKKNILKKLNYLDKQKDLWHESVINEKSLFQYLKDNIYNGQS
jgi:hypothetical protein